MCRKRSGVRSCVSFWSLLVTSSDISVTFFVIFFARLALSDSFCGRVRTASEERRELTEFCGKLGEFCEKLGEFAVTHTHTKQ